MARTMRHGVVAEVVYGSMSQFGLGGKPVVLETRGG